ncbi:PREDICTED: protein AAR2 homolog isoform X2 [Tarenaya hassleriana]|uniref:protein AAR2 homolog isoform X2 n=1 Tax=Tarenaya hassleriana TaxID=28532 RepID=UPI00053C90C1|nr:PREDICTED: protein AAR2 homolog isoform X2 [Tarenaya hassleriana]
MIFSLQMFSVGPAFKGIKMIPPGIHFVFYSSSSRDGKEFSPITGFFVDAGPSQAIVRKWDHQEERLTKVSEEEEERYAQAIRNLEFDRYLGPYNLSQYATWKQLSNYITKDIVEKIEPVGGEITVIYESSILKGGPKTSMEKALDEQLKTSKFKVTSIEQSTGQRCYYTSIPRIIKRKGMSGQELTSMNLDKTQLLESILSKEYGGSEELLLGELQFSFVAFLMGQSLEAFMQWKSLVSLLLGCTDAPFRTRSHLFTKFVKVIYQQLKYGLQRDSSNPEVGAPALLDDSWLSADSFLHLLCKDFFALVEEASVVDGDLLLWTRKLKELLQNSLGWEFQKKSALDGIYFEDDDEYAPVVEMLDESHEENMAA